MPKEIKATTTGYNAMVCDCSRAGADMDAFDLPVVPLLCDGDCTKVVTLPKITPDVDKRAEYTRYLAKGGKKWKR